MLDIIGPKIGCSDFPTIQAKHEITTDTIGLTMRSFLRIQRN